MSEETGHTHTLDSRGCWCGTLSKRRTAFLTSTALLTECLSCPSGVSRLSLSKVKMSGFILKVRCTPMSLNTFNFYDTFTCRRCVRVRCWGLNHNSHCLGAEVTRGAQDKAWTDPAVAMLVELTAGRKLLINTSFLHRRAGGEEGGEEEQEEQEEEGYDQ